MPLLPKPHYLWWYWTPLNASALRCSVLPSGALLHGGPWQPPPLISSALCGPSYPRGWVPVFRQPLPAQWEPQQSQGPVRWVSPNLWPLWSLPTPGEFTQKVEELKWFNRSSPFCYIFYFWANIHHMAYLLIFIVIRRDLTLKHFFLVELHHRKSWGRTSLDCVPWNNSPFWVEGGDGRNGKSYTYG